MAKEKWDRNREEIQELVQQEKMIFEGAFLNFCNKVFSKTVTFVRRPKMKRDA